MVLTIKGKFVLTMDDKLGIIRDGAVVVEGSKIIDVGPQKNMKEKHGEDEVIDIGNGVVMPGLISSHTHIYGILSHGMPVYNAPTTFIGFLEDFWWPYVENLLDKDMIYAAAKMSSIEMIRTGTTAFADILEAPNAIPGALEVEAKAVNEVGLRGILSFEATERMSRENGQLGIKENLDFIKKYNEKESSLVRGMFSIHTTFTCSDEFLREVRELANKIPAGIHIHLEEGAYESMYSLVNRRKLPVEFYEEIGFLGPDLIASQCVHTTPKEMEILKKYDVKISHMPVSNCEVGGGIAPVPEYLEKGLTVGLGTDGYVVDMFEVMRFAFLIHKANKQDASVMPADIVIKMATRDNAKVIMWENEIGSLTPGKKADIITIRNEFPTPLTDYNLVAQLVTFGTGNMVNDVIIDGKLVMRDREILTVDVKKAEEDIKAQANRLWSMIEERTKH